jgi:molybdate transport system ATP-binding protein
VSSSVSFDCRHAYSAGFQLDAQFEADSQVTALFGPSGSGKTTIVRLLSGLLKPDRGRIRLGDRVVTDTQSGLFLRPEQRRVGLLFQHHCLFPHQRVRANISYGISRRGAGGISMERIVETLELDDLLDRYPQSLSGGQQERVALARAIASGPKLLLLDEPLTSVEAALRERIAAFIERVVDEFEIPTLLVSHNRSLVDRLATRVLRIEDGTIVNSPENGASMDSGE